MKRVVDIGDLGATYVEHDTPLTKNKSGKPKVSLVPHGTPPRSSDVVPDPPSPIPSRPQPEPEEPPLAITHESASSPWPWVAAAVGVAIAGGIGWAVGRAHCTCDANTWERTR